MKLQEFYELAIQSGIDADPRGRATVEKELSEACKAYEELKPEAKETFDPEKLKANLNAIMEVIYKAKPQTAKGVYVKNVTVSTTMGPGIKVDVAELAAHHA